MAKEIDEGILTSELSWFPLADMNLKNFEMGWVLVSDGVSIVPAFLGYRLFRKKPKWCSAITRHPLDWEPTYIAYPLFPTAKLTAQSRK